MAPLPAPSRSGVRIAGDMYQWLVVWRACLTALRDRARGAANPVITVGVEVDGAGNLDDVVLYRSTPPHTYAQVKYAVDSANPINEAYLLEPSKSNGPSILRKIADSWRHLAVHDLPIELGLISNRTADPADQLVSVRDARTSLLLPKAALGGPQSATGRARARWAAGAGLNEAQLLGLLGILRFEIGRDPQHLHELVSLQMLAVGLRHDDQAVDAAAAWVGRQVRDGHRTLDLSRIIDAVDEFDLSAGALTRAVVSIATLKPDPLADDADYALDWVDRFDGASDFSKRRPRPPATWAQLQDDIEAIPAHLSSGTTAVALTGSLRQATAFAVGAALRQVTGIEDLAVRQRGQLWSSSQHYDDPLPPVVIEHDLGRGGELAVAVAIAADPTNDVLEFLRAESVPVDRLLVLRAPAGASDVAIPDATAAVALAVGIRDAVRAASRRHRRVHLFLVGPLGLAALLGHRWNRIQPTIVYEDVRAEHTYEEAFSIDA